MTMEAQVSNAREYAGNSEKHAQLLIRAYRHSLKRAHQAIKEAEGDAQRALSAINAAKRVIYENGWTDE